MVREIRFRLFIFIGFQPMVGLEMIRFSWTHQVKKEMSISLSWACEFCLSLGNLVAVYWIMCSLVMFFMEIMAKCFSTKDAKRCPQFMAK